MTEMAYIQKSGRCVETDIEAPTNSDSSSDLGDSYQNSSVDVDVDNPPVNLEQVQPRERERESTTQGKSACKYM